MKTGARQVNATRGTWRRSSRLESRSGLVHGRQRYGPGEIGQTNSRAPSSAASRGVLLVNGFRSTLFDHHAGVVDHQNRPRARMASSGSKFDGETEHSVNIRNTAPTHHTELPTMGTSNRLRIDPKNKNPNILWATVSPRVRQHLVTRCDVVGRVNATVARMRVAALVDDSTSLRPWRSLRARWVGAAPQRP